MGSTEAAEGCRNGDSTNELLFHVDNSVENYWD
jgi:hypothetical protein